MANTAPASLSDIISAAQATASAQAASDPTPSTTPAASPATSEPAASTAADDSATAAAATGAAADDSATATAAAAAAAATDGAATAADGNAAAAAAAAATTPASIDWGAAMPALAAKAQQLLGEEAGVFTKYKSIDDLVRSIAEREKQVGQLSGYAGAFNNLSEHGVTIEMLRALRDRDVATLNALLGHTNGTPQSPSGGLVSGTPAWSKKYLAGIDPEGKPIFNRAELAKAGLTEAQAAQARDAWNAQLADSFAGPDAVEEFIAKIVDARLGPATQQTEQKLTAAQRQALAEQQAADRAQRAKDAEQAAVSDWAEKHADLLYLNKKDISAGASKFFQQMQDYIDTGAVNPNLLHAQQLEIAKNYVLAVNRPAAAAPTPSERAKRQPGTSTAPSKKLAPNEFYDKYHDRFGPDSEGFLEYAMYCSTGKIPEAVGR